MITIENCWFQLTPDLFNKYGINFFYISGQKLRDTARLIQSL